MRIDRSWLQFIASTVVWAGIARLMLEAEIANPVAIGIVWLIGFVWITGYIASGPMAADLLLKVWLGMLAAMGLLAGVGVLLIS